MAITQYYVDPAINANSGTGTIGDPYGDLQYALNTITRNATDGDQVNVKSGTAEVLAAALTLATYGTPTAAAPLVLRGYTASANDGGVGEISGGGSVAIWNAANTDYVHFIDMKMGNVGNNPIMANLRNYNMLYRCEIYGSTGNNGLLFSGATRMVSCYVHDGAGNYLMYSSGGCIIMGCYFDTGAVSPAASVVYLDNLGAIAINNIVRNRTTNRSSLVTIGPMVVGNTVVSENNTAAGIGVAANALVLNNIVQGHSGAGGKGFTTISKNVQLLRDNAAFNNTTNFAPAHDLIFESANNDELAATPFVDVATGDYDINGTVAGVTEDAWPASFPFITSTTPKADKGASQAGAGSGGGGAVSISPYRGNIG